jgi:hypothetical protein
MILKQNSTTSLLAMILKQNSTTSLCWVKRT